MQELVDQAQNPKSCWRRLIKVLSCCPYRFYMSNRINPVDDGVLDHMVRATTSISSPFIATACHTVCPGSPPCIGKRRQAVQEILRRQRVAELKRLGPDRLNNYKRFFQNSRVLLIPKVRDRRASLQPQLLSDMAAASSVAMRRASLLPLNMLRRSSVRPGIVVPKVRLCRAPAPSFIPEKPMWTNDHNQLQIPKWDYKMKRIERRHEEERHRLFPLRRSWGKRTRRKEDLLRLYQSCGSSGNPHMALSMLQYMSVCRGGQCCWICCLVSTWIHVHSRSTICDVMREVRKLWGKTHTNNTELMLTFLLESWQTTLFKVGSWNARRIQWTTEVLVLLGYTAASLCFLKCWHPFIEPHEDLVVWSAALLQCFGILFKDMWTCGQEEEGIMDICPTNRATAAPAIGWLVIGCGSMQRSVSMTNAVKTTAR